MSTKHVEILSDTFRRIGGPGDGEGLYVVTYYVKLGDRSADWRADPKNMALRETVDSQRHTVVRRAKDSKS